MEYQRDLQLHLQAQQAKSAEKRRERAKAPSCVLLSLQNARIMSIRSSVSQEYEPPAPAKATKKRKEVDESAKAFATLH